MSTSSSSSSDEFVDIDPNSVPRRGSRCAISAEADLSSSDDGEFVPPCYAKDEEQKRRIEEAMSKSFLFTYLDPGDRKQVLDAFQEQRIPAGRVLMREGEEGHELYLVEKGDLEVTKAAQGVVNVMRPGSTVGELALLYSAPRAATVTALTDGLLWRLDRRTFGRLVRRSAERKRERHLHFLRGVELLARLKDAELVQIADALLERTYPPSVPIVRQGEAGDRFYIIASGRAQAIKNGEVVLELEPGNYFGENALSKNQPRAATVMPIEEITCLELDAASFNRLMGPLQPTMLRNAANKYI